MDQNEAPLVEALADYHGLDRYGFTPPGHRQGRGADPRVREVLGDQTFRSDVLASAGLDDRSSSGGYLKKAEQLMAEAVGAEQAFFSTCGSSLSVKAAVLAVAAGKGDLLVEPGRAQIDRRRAGFFRDPAALDPAALGPEAAPGPSAGPGRRRGDVGTSIRTPPGS